MKRRGTRERKNNKWKRNFLHYFIFFLFVFFFFFSFEAVILTSCHYWEINTHQMRKCMCASLFCACACVMYLFMTCKLCYSNVMMERIDRNECNLQFFFLFVFKWTSVWIGSKMDRHHLHIYGMHMSNKSTNLWAEKPAFFWLRKSNNNGNMKALHQSSARLRQINSLRCLLEKEMRSLQ